MRPLVVVLGGVLAFTAGGIAWRLVRERVRRRRMAEATSALGLSSVPDSRALLEQDGLSAVPLLALAALGARVELANVARGRFDGLDLVAGDYRRTSGTPGHETEHRRRWPVSRSVVGACPTSCSSRLAVPSSRWSCGGVSD